jgi:hypothetical protein
MSRTSASSELDPTPPGTDIESLPGPVVERFTRKIQPILVNNCTTSGCHQRGGAQQFQLDRALLHGLANRRSTMRNLTAALTLVDGEQPQLSPLLIVPRQTHGGMSAPIFGPRQAELFHHLFDWVSLVTRSEPTQPLPLAANMPSGEITLANNTEPISGSKNGASPESDFLTSQDVQQQFSLRAKPLVRFGARLEAWRPKDEFDPEIFNRQQRVQPEVDAEDNASNSIVPTEHR